MNLGSQEFDLHPSSSLSPKTLTETTARASYRTYCSIYCKRYKMRHLWPRYKQKSPFQESTQAPQLCLCYTVRVIGHERHEQKFNELSVFGSSGHRIGRVKPGAMDLVQSFLWISSLDMQVVSNTKSEMRLARPFASEDSTPWKAPRTFDCIFKQRNNKNRYICFICQYHEDDRSLR